MCLYFGTLDVHDWLVFKHIHKIVSNLLAYSCFEQSNTYLCINLIRLRTFHK